MARFAAAGTLVLALNIALGTRSSAGEQTADATLAYVCPFPSGVRQIAVTIAGTFPGAAAAGRPIQPTDVTVTPRLPQAALADLAGLDATSVTASAELAVTVAQPAHAATAAWTGLTAPSVPIPGSGDLPLPASGPVPAATAASAGTAAFLAGALTLVLTPHRADGGATDPATLPLRCTLEVGPDAVLATVPVTGPAGAASPGAIRRERTPRTARPADDDPCVYTADLPPVPGEAYMAGFSNVDKLKGATLLGREDGQTTGHVDLELGYRLTVDLCSPAGDTHIFSRALLDHHGEHRLPPAKATFLTFGFMPTTATLDLTAPPGTDLEIDSHGYSDGTGYFEDTTVTSRLEIRVHDVLVNGTPLDVGPHCESAAPMPVTLLGRSPDYTVNTGGPLTGTATIPPFSGCGVGEDLDPLFDASISGPGNDMKLTQGMPCTRPPDSDPQNCDPIDRPAPRP
jgi:uncharacterized protein DUF6801